MASPAPECFRRVVPGDDRPSAAFSIGSCRPSFVWFFRRFATCDSFVQRLALLPSDVFLLRPHARHFAVPIEFPQRRHRLRLQLECRVRECHQGGDEKAQIEIATVLRLAYIGESLYQILGKTGWIRQAQRLRWVRENTIAAPRI
jgi:hypothetical protein